MKKDMSFREVSMIVDNIGWTKKTRYTGDIMRVFINEIRGDRVYEAVQWTLKDRVLANARVCSKNNKTHKINE